MGYLVSWYRENIPLTRDAVWGRYGITWLEGQQVFLNEFPIWSQRRGKIEWHSVLYLREVRLGFPRSSESGNYSLATPTWNYEIFVSSATLPVSCAHFSKTCSDRQVRTVVVLQKSYYSACRIWREEALIFRKTACLSWTTQWTTLRVRLSKLLFFTQFDRYNIFVDLDCRTLRVNHWTQIKLHIQFVSL